MNTAKLGSILEEDSKLEEDTDNEDSAIKKYVKEHSFFFEYSEDRLNESSGGEFGMNTGIGKVLQKRRLAEKIQKEYKLPSLNLVTKEDVDQRREEVRQQRTETAKKIMKKRTQELMLIED